MNIKFIPKSEIEKKPPAYIVKGIDLSKLTDDNAVVVTELNAKEYANLRMQILNCARRSNIDLIAQCRKISDGKYSLTIFKPGK